MIPISILIFIFLIGLMIGSFLNVCIYRIPLEKTIVKGRSFCPSCGELIPWYLNIPVLSYLFLGGKCRYCKERISPIYPAVELLNAVQTLICFLLYGLSFTSLFLSILFALLIVISFIDLNHQMIPDGLVIAVAFLGALHAGYRILFLHEGWHVYLIGLFAASLPLLILGLVYPDGMGGGDIKFMAAAGLFAGWKLILLSLFLGSLIALLYIIVQLFRKKTVRGVRIPFAPFLSAGIALSLLAGNRLIELYLQLVLGF